MITPRRVLIVLNGAIGDVVRALPDEMLLGLEVVNGWDAIGRRCRLINRYEDWPGDRALGRDLRWCCRGLLR